MFSWFKKRDSQVDLLEKRCHSESYDDVGTISEYFRDLTGITFDTQVSILKNKLTSFCRQRAICSFNELLKQLGCDSMLKQELIDYLTTNETFFYREFKQIEQLVELVKNSNANTTILCAPCSSGEEPYSIAIALLEAGVSKDSFSIVGIDINSQAINLAKEAKYKERNVRNLSPKILSEYFVEDGDFYILKDSIKSKVKFSVENIFDEKFKKIGKFDYIFSRNMLIYFDKNTKLKAKKILEDLRKNPSQEIFFGHADLF